MVVFSLLVYVAKEELKTKKRWCDFIKVFMKVVYGLKPKIQFHKRNWLQKAKKHPAKICLRRRGGAKRPPFEPQLPASI